MTEKERQGSTTRNRGDSFWVPGVQATREELADHLQSAVSGAWQRGWQPADLVRIVSRRLTNRHVSLTRVAIAAQMQHYAPETIDPRWTSQLSDLEARVWWRPDQSHLKAWAETEKAEWSAAVSCVLEVLDLITSLRSCRS